MPRLAAGPGGCGSGGVEPGDRVALYTGNKIPFLFAQLGVLYAGACPLPLNPRFTREEMRYFLSDSEARMVIAGAEELPLVAALARAAAAAPRASRRRRQRLRPVPRAERRRRRSADDPLQLGHDGLAEGRGALDTPARPAACGLQTCWQLTADDVVLNVLPLYHIHGLEFATHLTWLAGGCIRVEESFDVGRTLAAIGKSTVFMAVPAIYYRLLESAEFRTAAVCVESHAALHLRLGPDSPGSAPRAGRDFAAPGDQSLRHERVVRDHQSAAGRALAERLGGASAAGDGAKSRPQRRLARRSGRSGQRAHPQPELVSRILAQAGGDPGRLSRRLVRHGRSGLARRARLPHARRPQERT